MGVLLPERRPRPLQTVFISRGLNHRVVEANKVTTSSQKFELEFIREYSKLSPVTIVYIGREPCESKELSRELGLTCSTYRNLFNVIRRTTGREKSVVLATGYDPRVIFVLIFLRLFGYRCYSFVYDTHTLYASNKPFARRTVINVFFAIGFSLARFINGWLVLNDAFIKKDRVKIEYLKLKVGATVPSRMVDGVPSSSGDSIVFLFAGTLNEDNGTKLLLEAVRSIPRDGFQVHIYGYGPLSPLVRQYAAEDRRVIFFGTTDNDVVLQKQREADFLIHLRNPNSVAIDIAYPSKLIEYLCSGTPVLSNIFANIGDDVADSVVSIENYGQDGIRRAILNVLDGNVKPPPREQIFARLQRERGWDRIASAVAGFVRVKQ